MMAGGHVVQAQPVEAVVIGQPVGQVQPVVVAAQPVGATGAFVAAPGFVPCMLVNPRNGMACGQVSQYTCTNCGRHMCHMHRRFWAGRVCCADCQQNILQQQGGVFCCVVQ
eukprot:gnl/TRDRNA2_/TRDRNA2_157321_c0_seq2.p3 gnl/TRDRNA2_/TRDRNA2_157321_c0~~gnl/TRDRNA2_/TRDRNA2_157321_c0_seq2.p3  ORF type:complete len:111 (+),score=10.73 gnl/TRDRNA2_/TRDRNA2_157321_c0_seq2:85-417(+)